MDRDAPVFLIFVIDKTEVDNITAAQTKQLKALARAIKDQRAASRAAKTGRTR